MCRMTSILSNQTWGTPNEIIDVTLTNPWLPGHLQSMSVESFHYWTQTQFNVYGLYSDKGKSYNIQVAFNNSRRLNQSFIFYSNLNCNILNKMSFIRPCTHSFIFTFTHSSTLLGSMVTRQTLPLQRVPLLQSLLSACPLENTEQCSLVIWDTAIPITQWPTVCWPALRAGLLCCNFFGQPGSVSKFPPFLWVKLWVGWVGRGYKEISRYFPA